MLFGSDPGAGGSNWVTARPYNYTGQTVGTGVAIADDDSGVHFRFQNSSEQVEYEWNGIGGEANIDVTGYIEEL